MAYCKRLDPWLITVPDDDLQAAVLRQTDGRGVDVCITACPSVQAQADALHLMAMCGRVLYFGGLPTGNDQVLLNTNLIHYRQLKIFGSTRANVPIPRGDPAFGVRPHRPGAHHHHALSVWRV
jgi:L-iditol 2-dehydrogenase